MGLFDGLTGIAASVLGGPVSFTPATGAGAGVARTVQSILRRTPVRATGPDGDDVLITSPTWRVRADLVPDIARDDIVSHGGRTYRVLNAWPLGSPAADAHLICALEDVT